MFCPACGKSLPDNSSFCSVCGKQILISKSSSSPVKRVESFAPPVQNEGVKKLTDVMKENKTQGNAPLVMYLVSPADELKKFKELLDLDVITQEEFDIKKKQLLGL